MPDSPIDQFLATLSVWQVAIFTFAAALTICICLMLLEACAMRLITRRKQVRLTTERLRTVVGYRPEKEN